MELANKRDKTSHLKLRKVLQFLKLLRENGFALHEPYIKHIEGDLWELRPVNDRYFFVSWTGDTFVILHPFVKKTQKTPQREIDQAKRELADLKKRGLDDNDD